MAVYVDQARHGFGRMIMCHMVADTTDELLEMVDRIGVQRKWIQRAGTYHEHFDICMSKRALAVAAGAIELDRMGLGMVLSMKRQEAVRRLEAAQ